MTASDILQTAATEAEELRELFSDMQASAERVEQDRIDQFGMMIETEAPREEATPAPEVDEDMFTLKEMAAFDEVYKQWRSVTEADRNAGRRLRSVGDGAPVRELLRSRAFKSGT